MKFVGVFRPFFRVFGVFSGSFRVFKGFALSVYALWTLPGPFQYTGVSQLYTVECHSFTLSRERKTWEQQRRRGSWSRETKKVRLLVFPQANSSEALEELKHVPKTDVHHPHKNDYK